MNLTYLIKGIRRFGLRGIIDQLKEIPKKRGLDRWMRKSCIRTKGFTPEKGITLIASFSYPGSLSKTMRDFATRLKANGIPYQAYDLPSTNRKIPAAHYIDFITPPEEFHANKYTHVIEMFSKHGPYDPRCKNFRLGFWEFETGLTESCPSLLGGEDVIGFSDFNVNVFRANLPRKIPVHKILYPFQFTARTIQPRDVVREKHGIGRDDFVVFFNFDYASSYYRKNPEGLVKAFALAFAGVPGTVLLLKTMRAQKCRVLSERLKAYARECGIEKQVVCVDDYISQDELVGLTATADVYCSLHRGEGFGIGIAEAMHLGIPAVVTDYSSTREFCNAANSIPVPYTLVDVKKEQIDVDAYKSVKKWAEPDVQAAANALRKLYENPPFRRELGERAKAFIDDYFSDANFKKSICDFLNRRTDR